jgi:hypothetical protein
MTPDPLLDPEPPAAGCLGRVLALLAVLVVCAGGWALLVGLLLPTPGDWIALAAWIAFAGTIVAFLVIEWLERRRAASDPVEDFAELRRALRPDRIVVSPEALERIRRTVPDAQPIGTWGGVPIITSNLLPPAVDFVVLQDLDFNPPPPPFFADDPYDGTFLGSTS